jgi:GMP synthase-like glutamine amidotransferase
MLIRGSPALPSQKKSMPKITIIEAGLVPPEQRTQHGSFPQMFERMIGAADASTSFATVRLADGEELPDPTPLEAILITGSAAGVYDDFDWIAPLERFVRAAYEAKIPMVGVCFGHQLIAQALGGTVRKSEKGWGIGRHVYDIVPGNGAIDGETIAIAASHQDQVIEPPAGATTILHSTFCAARRNSLRKRRGAVGAATSRIHRRLCRILLREGRPQRRSRSIGRDRQGFAGTATR